MKMPGYPDAIQMAFFLFTVFFNQRLLLLSLLGDEKSIISWF